MSEEVTYADLNFQHSSKTENIQNYKNTGKKVYRTTKIEMEKLQHLKEEFQRNVSLQQMSIMNISKDHSTILQNIATKLCREIVKNNKEHKCKPCPEKWMWHEDTCYSISEDFQTWQHSENMCSQQNATLLKIKSKSVLEFIKKILKSSSYYWIGLTPTKTDHYETESDKIISSPWYERSMQNLNEAIYCGYLYGRENVYSTKCSDKIKYICEKMASPVKVESVLNTEVLDEK
ncbi:PREDICTED: C-type lectin domain family 12 member A [Elephantulus edwardii]|uniref:C-type lectin domain family 12 member A n=1 Tax=Elephantulus edwardii TaxID=28737 RepID=UPI0003F0DDB7|nr:PREDICTED: C-type lectin domain family 12 member A [Elephantulus edwardii]